MLLNVALAARDAGDAVPPPDCVTEDGAVAMLSARDANSGLVCTCGSSSTGPTLPAAMPGDEHGEAGRACLARGAATCSSTAASR